MQKQEMKQFVGTKIINAKPMNRLEYNQFRGWSLSADENGADEGFLVEYIDGGKANTDQYAGYVSWSPKDVFEKAYRRADGMTFGAAIEAMKARKRVARAGWNGKNMFIYLSIDVLQTDADLAHDNEASIFYKKTIDAHDEHGVVKTWSVSVDDVLADDWMLYDNRNAFENLRSDMVNKERCSDWRHESS